MRKTLPWATRYGWALLLVMLAGCATPVGGRSASTPWSPTHALLTMSGDPAGGGSGPVVRGYKVPGRNPDSDMPWEFFLGQASHRLIAYMYGVNHPNSQTYYNNKCLKTILGDKGLGDVSRLKPHERKMCPDITDVSLLVLFEIKPWNDRGLREGRTEVRQYLALLNGALLEGKPFSGGLDFNGEILIRFARGNHIWRLEWKTQDPGVVQYRWTRSQQPFDSEAEAYKAARWVDITEAELRQYGGWVEKAVEGMLDRRERLATLRGSVGLVIDLVGGVATIVLWGAVLGQGSTGAKVQQPPAQPGAQIIPFPTRPPSAVPAAPMPAASGMSLPR